MSEIRRKWVADDPSYKDLAATFIVRECLALRLDASSTTTDLSAHANDFDDQYMTLHAKVEKPAPHNKLNILGFLMDNILSVEVNGKRIVGVQAGGKGQPWTFVESSRAGLCELGLLKFSQSTQPLVPPTVDEQTHIIAIVGRMGSGKTNALREAAQDLADQGLKHFAINCGSGNLKHAAEHQGNWAFDKDCVVQHNTFADYFANKVATNEWQKSINAPPVKAPPVAHFDDDIASLFPQSTGQGVVENRKLLSVYFSGARMPVGHHVINAHGMKQVAAIKHHLTLTYVAVGGARGLTGHLQADPTRMDEAHANGIKNIMLALGDDFVVAAISKIDQRGVATALHAGHEQMRQEAIATKLVTGAKATVLTGPDRMKPVKIVRVGTFKGTCMYEVTAKKGQLTRNTYRREELYSGFTGNVFVQLPLSDNTFHVVRRAAPDSALGPRAVPDSHWFVPPPPPPPRVLSVHDFKGFGDQAVAESTDDEGIVWEDGPVRYHHSHCLSLHNCLLTIATFVAGGARRRPG
jgi:hypothetical protein